MRYRSHLHPSAIAVFQIDARPTPRRFNAATTTAAFMTCKNALLHDQYSVKLLMPSEVVHASAPKALIPNSQANVRTH